MDRRFRFRVDFIAIVTSWNFISWISSSSSLIVSLFLALEQGSTTIKLDLETEDWSFVYISDPDWNRVNSINRDALKNTRGRSDIQGHDLNWLRWQEGLRLILLGEDVALSITRVKWLEPGVYACIELDHLLDVGRVLRRSSLGHQDFHSRGRWNIDTGYIGYEKRKKERKKVKIAQVETRRLLVETVATNFRKGRFVRCLLYVEE